MKYTAFDSYIQPSETLRNSALCLKICLCESCNSHNKYPLFLLQH